MKETEINFLLVQIRRIRWGHDGRRNAFESVYNSSLSVNGEKRKGNLIDRRMTEDINWKTKANAFFVLLFDRFFPSIKCLIFFVQTDWCWSMRNSCIVVEFIHIKNRRSWFHLLQCISIDFKAKRWAKALNWEMEYLSLKIENRINQSLTHTHARRRRRRRRKNSYLQSRRRQDRCQQYLLLCVG